MTDATNDAFGPAKPKPPSKASIVVKLLSRPRGAALVDIHAVTNWQAHSIRAFLTGLRKKGVNLIREQRRDGVTAYRIVKTRAATENSVASDDMAPTDV